ncbi:MAG: hypothetical protein GY847_23825 [Proteobacteria bacterium]|nr:hypothetical protein [Pseudomonadota bacterium]
MEGRDVWDPSVPETFEECTWRLNNIHRRRISVLSGEADHEFEAANRAPAIAIALAEVVDLDEFPPDDTEVDPICHDELEGYRIPPINACPPIFQPPPRFMPGCGFARYLPRPALQAHALPFSFPAPPRLPP